MPLDIHLTGAEDMDPQVLERVAHALLVMAGKSVEPMVTRKVGDLSVSMPSSLYEKEQAALEPGVKKSDAVTVAVASPQKAVNHLAEIAGIPPAPASYAVDKPLDFPGQVTGAELGDAPLGPSVAPGVPGAPASASPDLEGFGTSPLPPGAVPLPGAASTAGVPPPPSAPATIGVPPPPSAAPPAPTVQVPAPPAPSAASPDNPVQTDKRGLPWDERIHTSTRSVNADGSWRNKPRVDATYREGVENELRQLMSTPAPVQAAGVPPPPAAPETDVWPDFLMRVAGARSAGKLDINQVNEVCAKFGIAQMPLLANRPDIVPAVEAELVARGLL